MADNLSRLCGGKFFEKERGAGNHRDYFNLSAPDGSNGLEKGYGVEIRRMVMGMFLFEVIFWLNLRVLVIKDFNQLVNEFEEFVAGKLFKWPENNAFKLGHWFAFLEVYCVQEMPLKGGRLTNIIIISELLKN